MTTQAQVKRFCRPVLERNPDVVLVGRRLILTPIRHVICSVLFDATSMKNIFHPFPSRLALVYPRSRLNGIGAWGDMMLRGKPGSWSWTGPEAPEEFAFLFETVALPILRAANNLEVLAGLMGQFSRPEHVLPADHHTLPVGVALGWLEWARWASPFVVTYDQRYPDPNMHEIYRWERSQVEQLHPLIMADDRPGMVALLREFEATTARNCKLEPYVRPEPFPLEAMLLVATRGCGNVRHTRFRLEAYIVNWCFRQRSGVDA